MASRDRRRKSEDREALRNKLRYEALSRQQKPKENSICQTHASTAIQNRRSYANRQSTAGTGSVWVASIVAILVIAGIAAYSYRGSMTASNKPATTTGHLCRRSFAAGLSNSAPADRFLVGYGETPGWGRETAVGCLSRERLAAGIRDN
jgi:hypothetical protein